MRRLTLLIILSILLLWVRSGEASPFLVCDPQAGVLEYQVEIRDGVTVVMGGIQPAEADTTCRFDLEGIPNGVYNAFMKAGNLWGWSDWSQPYGFVVERCGQPTGILIVR